MTERNRVSATLGVATLAFALVAPTLVSASDWADNADMKKAEIALYDALAADPSPRNQVLVAGLYIDSEAEAAPLRRSSVEVVDRAVRLASDDGFVQWVAASEGRYSPSQCGPSRLPEAEVANLLRLEPDNAGAWLYSVALAAAIGDQDAVDSGLSNMAAAARADDHSHETLVTWQAFYLAHPKHLEADVFWTDGDASVEESAFTRALLKAFSGSPPSAFYRVEAVCTPDPASDRVWQRMGWCADAGRLLAAEGSSVALREFGFKLLAAVNVADAEVDAMQRQLDWLTANSALPFRGSSTSEAINKGMQDWQNVGSELAATENRLKRLGKPLAPPAGWSAQSDDDEVAAESSNEAWQQYMRSLHEGLRASDDVREQALSLVMAAVTNDEVSDTPAPAEGTSGLAQLEALATLHPDNRFVQWIAAMHGKASEAVIANLQRLEPDNSAAWGLSLQDADDQSTVAILELMAASERSTTGFIERLALWSKWVESQPVPAGVIEYIAKFSGEDMTGDHVESPETLVRTFAISNLGALTTFDSSLQSLAQSACDPESMKESERKQVCGRVGRVMFDRGDSLLAGMFGEALLRRADAMTASDITLARHRAWWWQVVAKDASTMDALPVLLADAIASNSEIEAYRLAAERLGKSEPPANWESPADVKARKETARESTSTPETDLSSAKTVSDPINP